MAAGEPHGDVWIVPPGTHVVTRRETKGEHGRVVHPAGAAALIVKSPVDPQQSYRVRFPDHFEASLPRREFALLAEWQRDPHDGWGLAGAEGQRDRVILRCVLGSRAYGLETEASDTDRRGVYLPRAETHWSLAGVPEQLEFGAEQEVYWELRKFLALALKANPNVLECLYVPAPEFATPLGRELLSMRDAFLSKLAYQTFNGYVLSQFRKMRADGPAEGRRWKPVMHLLRLLLAGIGALRDGTLPVRVDEHRDWLLAVKRGERPWPEVEARRLALHAAFDEAYRASRLPERPDYARANAFLVKARRLALEDGLP